MSFGIAQASLAYPVMLSREGKTWLARLPDFDDSMTQGKSRAAALDMAADLLETVVSHRIAAGLPVPRPSATRGRPLVQLSTLSAAKLHLRDAFTAAGISQAALARRLGQTPQQVGRLFDLRHRSAMAQIDQAMRTLNRQIVVQVKAT